VKLPPGLIAAALGAHLLTARASAQPRDQVYRYVEAEAPAASSGMAFRDEGFTSWMGHPSGGRTAIFDASPNPSVTYALDGLPAAPLYLFVRQLAFPAPQASVEATVDGRPVGITEFDRPGTMLAWSRRLGPFAAGPSSTLTIRPAAGSSQAPYLDVLLVTNDPDAAPDNTDQDYRSATVRVGASGVEFGAFRLNAIAGKAAVHLAATAAQPVRVSLCVTAREEGSKARVTAAREFRLAPGPNALAAPLKLLRGKRYSVLTEVHGPKGLLLFMRTASARVTEPVTLRLSGVCFSPGEQARAVAEINDPDAAAARPVLRLRVSSGARTLLTAEARSKGGSVQVALPVGKLPPGRYTLTAGLAGASLSAGFSVIPAIRDRLEPIRKVEATPAGLLVNGKPFVPRKLYHAAGTAAVKAQGYNSVDCWGGDTLEGVQAMLDEAWRNNVYGYGILFHPYFYKGIGKGFDLAALERGVEKLKGHPALLLWELYDEPDAGVPVAELEAACRLVRKLDPNHPVLLNFCFPAKFAEYSGPCDIVSVDTYPVPHAPLTLVPETLDKLRATAGRKPMQIALQGYGDVKGRMPTPQELRCMAYLSINHGATAFAVYSYSEGKGYPLCLEADPILWSFTRELNREMLLLRDAIVAPVVAVAAPASLDVTMRRTPTGAVAIAVNKTGTRVRAAFGAGEFSRAAVLFEGREVKAAAGRITDTFEPYAVHVYRARQ
jgi:hypothetical protein